MKNKYVRFKSGFPAEYKSRDKESSDVTKRDQKVQPYPSPQFLAAYWGSSVVVLYLNLILKKKCYY